MIAGLMARRAALTRQVHNSEAGLLGASNARMGLMNQAGRDSVSFRGLAKADKDLALRQESLRTALMANEVSRESINKRLEKNIKRGFSVYG